jgi:hypothetical protein
MCTSRNLLKVVGYNSSNKDKDNKIKKTPAAWNFQTIKDLKGCYFCLSDAVRSKSENIPSA